VAGRLVPPPAQGGRVLLGVAARSRQLEPGRRGSEPRLACGCHSRCIRTRPIGRLRRCRGGLEQRAANLVDVLGRRVGQPRTYRQTLVRSRALEPGPISVEILACARVRAREGEAFGTVALGLRPIEGVDKGSTTRPLTTTTGLNTGSAGGEGSARGRTQQHRRAGRPRFWSDPLAPRRSASGVETAQPRCPATLSTCS
jgi:hypothetical protein